MCLPKDAQQKRRSRRMPETKHPQILIIEDDEALVRLLKASAANRIAAHASAHHTHAGVAAAGAPSAYSRDSP